MDIADLLTGLLSEETRAHLFDLVVGLSALSMLLRKAADRVQARAERTSTTADDKAARGLYLLAGAVEAAHRLIRPLSLRGRGKP